MFTNSVKRHIYHFKNSQLRHDLSTSVNDRVIGFNFMKLSIFVKIKPLQTFPNSSTALVFNFYTVIR